LKRLLALGATALVVAGCGGGSHPSAAPAPHVSPASLVTPTGGCAQGVVPRGYALDRAHTGDLTSHTYSASADVQAALAYDQLKAGSRRIFLHHAAGTHSAVDGVVSCVTLTFATADGATRFFGSYRTLRQQAHEIARKVAAPAVAGLAGTTAYAETQQSFRGYGISSTNVFELAGLDGQTLDIVSVAGHSPSRHLAATLAETLVSGS
jgi:hypothetical protein